MNIKRKIPRAKGNVVTLSPSPVQQKFLESRADIAVLGGAAGGGKAIPLSEVIPKIDGWTTMEELKLGDELFDEKGNTCRVTKLFPIIENPELYRFTFDDGSTIDSCKDHLWLTFTDKERGRLLKQTPEWKEKRRSSHPSRSKNTGKDVSYLVLRNKTKKRELPPEIGKIRTTQEIVETLKVRNRINHAIPIAQAIELPEKGLPIDPYILGLWLGDGGSGSGYICKPDLAYMGWEKLPSSRYTFKVPGLRQALKQENLLNNKHIPVQYLRASRVQRLALLQGLMDTDGSADKDKGSVEFSNTNERIIDGIIELACSLGHKPGTKIERRARLNGKDSGPYWRIVWTPIEYVFRLERKKSRQILASRPITKFRYIIKAEKIPSAPSRCIQVDSPSKLFLAGKRFIPTHNSYSLLMEPLRHLVGVHANGEFGAVVFRRNATQVRNEGGLWHESRKMYSPFGAMPREMSLEWTFPCGGRVRFAHLEYAKTVYEWQGSQVPLLGFDELTHFEEEQFFYMLSRNRSTCGIPAYVRATTNPDADSWVRKFLDWWIDPETGFPRPERAGVLRWMVRLENKIEWGDSREEMEQRFPLLNPKSVTFIPAKLQDNKVLMEKDPGYLANLMAQDRVERERLLDGNWNTRPSAGAYFQRGYFKIIEAVNTGIVQVIRAWDRAATVASETNRNPDYTVGLKLAKLGTGIWVVLDVVRFRGTPLEVERQIRNIAEQDGFDVPIALEEDPGASGKADVQNLVRVLAGFNVRLKKPSKDKETRAKPVSAQAEAGNIFILRAAWNDYFLKELENFPEATHDDCVDALSSAFNELSKNFSILNVL